jgi:ribosomal subunit interface protein
MKINVTYKNITPDKPLEFFIDDKIGSLGKFLKEDLSAVRVEIGKPSRHHRHGEVFRAEANLKINGKLIRAEAKHTDLRAAIVKVKNELQVQIKKMKGKKERLRKAKR